MNTDRPLAARYDEFVFPEKSWSPTVAQALGLLKIDRGEELPADLIDSLIQSSATRHKDTLAELLVSRNRADLRIRQATGFIIMQSVGLNILQSPGEPTFQGEMEKRNAILMAAVALIGLQMSDEV